MKSPSRVGTKKGRSGALVQRFPGSLRGGLPRFGEQDYWASLQRMDNSENESHFIFERKTALTTVAVAVLVDVDKFGAGQSAIRVTLLHRQLSGSWWRTTATGSGTAESLDYWIAGLRTGWRISRRSWAHHWGTPNPKSLPGAPVSVSGRVTARRAVQIPERLGTRWSRIFENRGGAHVVPVPLADEQSDRNRSLHSKAILRQDEKYEMLMVGSSKFPWRFQAARRSAPAMCLASGAIRSIGPKLAAKIVGR